MRDQLESFTVEEVEGAIKIIARNKAVGVDCLPDNLYESSHVRQLIT